MESTTTVVKELPTLLVAAHEDGEKENASEIATLKASLVVCATTLSTTEYSTEPSVCQIAGEPAENESGKEKAATDVAAHVLGTEYTTDGSACQIEPAPTLDEIENEIATAAHARIEAALADLNETRARTERERAARENALRAAQERVASTRSDLDRLTSERAAMEQRAQAFLVGDLLKVTLEKIHLAFNVRQLELEDALAVAEADVQDTRAEIQAATISDALELQLTEQHLDQLEAVAPEVARTVHLAADAAGNLSAALKATKEGLLRDADALLQKAKAGNADPTQVAEVERVLAEAQRAKIARDLMAQIDAIAERPGAVRRIRKLIEEADAAGVAKYVARHARHALDTARRFSNARYAQAKPIAEHLATEGYVPVVRDGRIEVWKEGSKKGARTDFGSRSAARSKVWTLERVMLLRDGMWKTETPRVPVTRDQSPKRAHYTRRSNPSAAERVTPET